MEKEEHMTKTKEVLNRKKRNDRNSHRRIMKKKIEKNNEKET